VKLTEAAPARKRVAPRAAATEGHVARAEHEAATETKQIVADTTLRMGSAYPARRTFAGDLLSRAIVACGQGIPFQPAA
jgi:hypothetical protein